jgi:hypothetical protein
MINKTFLQIFLGILFSIGVKAQTSQRIIDYNSNQLAEKIAVKMKDSLSLSTTQYLKIIEANKIIHNSKMTMRKQYTGQDSILQVMIQKEEDKRDELYKAVLDDKQYFMYLQKKKFFLRIN